MFRSKSPKGFSISLRLRCAKYRGTLRGLRFSDSVAPGRFFYARRALRGIAIGAVHFCNFLPTAIPNRAFPRAENPCMPLKSTLCIGTVILSILSGPISAQTRGRLLNFRFVSGVIRSVGALIRLPCRSRVLLSTV